MKELDSGGVENPSHIGRISPGKASQYGLDFLFFLVAP